MENQKSEKSAGEVLQLAFKAVALGMSATAIVLGTLGAATSGTLITLLSIGLFAMTVSVMK